MYKILFSQIIDVNRENNTRFHKMKSRQIPLFLSPSLHGTLHQFPISELGEPHLQDPLDAPAMRKQTVPCRR